ncbi:oxidoreductase [Synechococcus phage ACG-2014f]|uniref:Oxidoreductase n=1 Tax=Synechococcus phage ACG-2014f TaxID=1493511 RepID=A0A0E3F830_9CAUD|nr:oxidoreductase [Synechococcus phage ACG-2014f]
MDLYGAPCPDPSYVIDHINGDGYDNRVENLQWLSQRDNIRKGRNVKGMTIEKAREMRELYRGGGVTVEEVASRFSIPFGSAAPILYGYRWAD